MTRWKRASGRVWRAGDELFDAVFTFCIIAFLVMIPLGPVWFLLEMGTCTGDRIGGTRNQVLCVQQAVEMYMTQNGGRCPSSMEELRASGVGTRVPRDGWGSDLRMVCGARIFVQSAGPDRKWNTSDDITNLDPPLAASPEYVHPMNLKVGVEFAGAHVRKRAIRE